MNNNIDSLTLLHSFLISIGLVLGTQASGFSLGLKTTLNSNVIQRQTPLSKDLGSDNFSDILDDLIISQSTGNPPNKGNPDGTNNELGSRGQCTQDARPQSLTPSSGIGVAMMETATELYFFIPQSIIRLVSPNDEVIESIGEKEKVTFTLNNITTDTMLYENQLELDLPLLLNLDLTKADPPIVFETGQTYQWTLTVNCDRTDAVPEYPSVSGLIRKVATEPSVIANSEVMSLGDRPLFYAENGLQYDAIAALIELIQMEPDNPEIEAIWQELLPEVSLDVVKPALLQTSEGQE